MDSRVASSGETQRRDGAEVLRVENLTVRYGALVALRDVSWSVRSGEILGIIGPNGAGKSSCFAAVTNAVSHSGQTFLGQRRRLDDEDLRSRQPWPAPDVPAELVLRRVDGSAECGCRNRPGVLRESRASLLLPWREAATRRQAELAACQLLEFFGIAAQYHDKLPGDIPYGVQRLLSVALAYGTGSKVLLLDEPAAGLGGSDMQKLADVLVEPAQAQSRARSSSSITWT